MDKRISLITLGCRDVAGLAAFYSQLGWQRVETAEEIVVFDLIGQSLGLYPLAALAKDIGVAEEALGHGAMTLGHNLASREQVDALVGAAEAAGGKVLKPPQEVFWGGYHSYFADPEGHIWEIAHNPFSPLREDGAFRWSGYGK